MSKKALEGVKVLECCAGISASYGAKLLAEIGAEVIKIEPPGTGDKARTMGGFPGGVPHPEKSGLFLFLNANKAGITLDILQEGGRKLFQDLVKSVDILIEDGPPDRFESLGLGYDELKKANPGLIMASLTDFGETGPYKNYKAYPINISHLSGQANFYPIPSDDLSREPVKLGGNIEAYDCGVVMAQALLAALIWRKSSGQGQRIRASNLGIQVYLTGLEHTAYPQFNTYVDRLAKNFRRSPGGIIKCKDGYVSLGFLQEHEWVNLLKLMGDPEWAKGDAYKDRMSRMAKMPEINHRINEWMKDRTRREIVQEGQSLGVTVTPVNTPKDVVESEQMKVRGFFTEIEHPAAGRMKFPRIPSVFSETPPAIDRAAPLLGQDNESIFCGQLGYSKEELEKLRHEGVI
jgi:crotonobetainyl-CoA:carnitine CoA-transferase CaiB-like acyl-CoA transferase